MLDSSTLHTALRRSLAAPVAVAALLAPGASAALAHVVPNNPHCGTETQYDCHIGGDANDAKVTVTRTITPAQSISFGDDRALFEYGSDLDDDGTIEDGERVGVSLEKTTLNLGRSSLSLSYVRKSGTDPGVWVSRCPDGQAGAVLSAYRIAPGTEISGTFTDPLGKSHTLSGDLPGGSRQGSGLIGVCWYV